MINSTQEGPETFEISDASDLRKWRTELPNLIDDLGLDPYERTLYVHYKRVCGANGGICYESVRTTAQRTKMSPAKVSTARRDLEDRGLVVTRGGKSAAPGEGGETVKVQIVDIWKLNFLFYSLDQRPDIDGWTLTKLQNWLKSVYDVNATGGERSPHERSVHQVNAQGQKRSPHERQRSPGEQKKELLKKEPSKKEPKQETGAAAPEARAPTAAAKLADLRQRHSADPLEALVAVDTGPPGEDSLGLAEDRPAGWRDASADEYAICKRVADLWTAGKLPWSADDIERHTAAAYQLLELHQGDARATLSTIDAYHAQCEGGFHIAGPYSLRNVIPQFLAERGKEQNGDDRERSSKPGGESGIQRPPSNPSAEAFAEWKRRHPDRPVREVPILGILQTRRPRGSP